MSPHQLLHEKVQRWIYRQQWDDLRAIQKDAILAFNEDEQDLIIAAPTAGGKTEAAFFPILSAIAENPGRSVRVLCVSPLKALINDQYDRLSLICKDVGIPVHRWHGDVPQSAKRALEKTPSGVLIITPESLEALFLRKSNCLLPFFSHLSWVVIDEFHVFLVSERGRQLQSLLNRLECVLRRKLRRIGLSATLGDAQNAGQVLSPGKGARILARECGGVNLKLQVKGVLNPQQADKDENLSPDHKIAEHLYKNLRGSNNLVFANSRNLVEKLANKLRRMSQKDKTPEEFFPHHGNLSKEIREELEMLLKKENRPITAVCTSTLELGIDIGQVKSVAQIGNPPSVAALRQRLGRSGRRGETGILRCYITENEWVDSADVIRPGLFQMAAAIELTLERWNEPHRSGLLHLSTLIHQILAITFQYGGVNVSDLYRLLLAGNAPFSNVAKEDFIALLRHLKKEEIIEQLADGTVLVADKGERITEHYTFFAVFNTPEEYRLVSRGKTIGTIPIGNPIFNGMFMIFAGKTWRVTDVDTKSNVVTLIRAKGGKTISFSSGGFMVHEVVRQKMKALYTSDMPKYLDREGRSLFLEGQKRFNDLGLDRHAILEMGKGVMIFPWTSDWIMSTLQLLYTGDKSVVNTGTTLVFVEMDRGQVLQWISETLKNFPTDPIELAARVANKRAEKFDYLIPEDLLLKEVACRDIDLEGARRVLEGLVG